MKVLLVSHSFEDNAREVYTPNFPYSLGLAYLTSYLESVGHEVQVLWRDGIDFESAQKEMLATLTTFQPDVLGIQMFTMNRVASYRLIEACTQQFPDIKIVIGGIHASALPEQLARRYPNVVVVCGEGERTFAELLEYYGGQRKALGDIAGLAFFDKEAVVMTPARGLCQQLDELPHPKHEIFFEQDPLRTMGHIVTTRGCPYQCSFCCLHIISERKHRKRSVDDVVREIVDLKNKYPRLERIQIHDDIFTLDNQRVIEFCQSMIDLDLNLKFVTSAKVKPVSVEMLGFMERAGFEKVMFGLETGAAELMAGMHKGIVKQDVEDLFVKLKKTKMIITTFLMIGFPGETEQTVNETIQFVKHLQKIKYNFIVGIGPIWVYPGTELYDIMKAKGLITDDFWLTDEDVPYFTTEHDLATLRQFQNKMLNHLSITRIFTWQGFVHHFMAMPVVVMRFLLQQRQLLRSLLGNALKEWSPGLYMKLYRIYKGHHVQTHS